MQQPIFLGLDQVLLLHQSMIATYGGKEGLRDLGLLQSALAMPMASSNHIYFHEDIFKMAAAYLFHIVQNHAFHDGNKRVGAAAAIIFLAMNDIQIDNDQDGLVELTMNVAMSKSDKSTIASFFRDKAIHDS